jgi:hypothetical protein
MAHRQPRLPGSDPADPFASLCAVKRSHLAAVLLLPAVVLPLTGCFNGQDATTTVQATMNSGNGVQAKQGDIRIENATVVKTAESGTATLVVRLINVGPDSDALTYVTIDGIQADLIVADDSAESGSSIEIMPGASLGFGYDSDLYISVLEGFDAEVSTYVPLELGFATAGLASMSVLTVPDTGYYAGITARP